MNTYIKALTIAAATVMTALTGTNQAAARMSKALNDTASVGMNALDYTLQKPLGSPLFEDKTFGDHFFLSGGAGISTYNDKPSGGFRPGLSGEISFGDWITPVHGWRVNLGAGSHSKKAGEPWKFFGSISADYIMNFSALLRGYRPSRRVEIIGALGAEYQRTRYDAVWGNLLGLRAALQARFNIQNNLYIYAEPRLALYAGKRFPDDGERRFRPDLSFNIGLGYRLLSKEERMRGATPFINNGDSHLFFGVGGGAWSFARKTVHHRTNPYGFGSFFIGKYITPTAGIRLKGEIGRIGRISDISNRYLAIGSLDFVWNLNAAFGGYRPDQVFDLSLNIGPALAYANRSEGKFYPGVKAGLTALFNLSQQWGIFIEPEVSMFTRSFNRNLNDRGYGPFVSLMAGLRYTFGNFTYDNPQSYKDFINAENYFFSFSGGPAKRWNGSFGKGGALQFGFGKRFSPISSWRVTADGDLFSAIPGYLSVGVGLDYLFSISTSMAGFNPYRVFDLSGLIGVAGGAGQYSGPLQGYLEGRVGLHGAFRLCNALDLYFEPQIAGNSLIGKWTPGWAPEFRFMVGLKYKLGTPATIPSGLADSFLADGRNFVSLSGGPALFSGSFVRAPHKVSGSIDGALGRWFSRISGARIGYTLDFITRQTVRLQRPYVSTVHADYMLNISSLMDSNPARRFHVLGIVGAGVSFSNLKKSKAGIMFETGGQFRYNLPAGIDVHIEPIVSFYPDRVVPGYLSGAGFVATGRVMGGLSYRF